jgi:signal transduction histidine kinase
LSLSTELKDRATVVLTVQDSGAGIAEEDLDRVFDAFFTRKTAGMGLGLAISRTIVEGHGGALRLAASGPQGSVFEVTLPAVL